MILLVIAKGVLFIGWCTPKGILRLFKRFWPICCYRLVPPEQLASSSLSLHDYMDLCQGAHTFCCGLGEVPAGDWFCSDCEARQAAAGRTDEILRRAWAVPDSASDSASEDDDDWSIRTMRRGGGSGDGASVSVSVGERAISLRSGRGLSVNTTTLLSNQSTAGRRRGRGAATATAGGRGRVDGAGTVAVVERGLASGRDGGSELGRESEEGQEEEAASASASSSSSGLLAPSRLPLRRERQQQQQQQQQDEADDGHGGRRTRHEEPEANSEVGDAADDGGDNNVVLLGIARPNSVSAANAARRANGDYINNQEGHDDDITVCEVSDRRTSLRDGAETGTAPPIRPHGRSSGGGGGDRAASSELLVQRDYGGDGRGRGRGTGVGAFAGSNLWPRVLASASSAVAPRFEFLEGEGSAEAKEDSEEEGEGEEGKSVVEQSFTDAMLAAEVGGVTGVSDGFIRPSERAAWGWIVGVSTI